MERMVLGRTGLEVYRLGLGGIPIQRVGEEEAVQTVLHAVERGVDFIDTSRIYTTSERRIGLALEQTDRHVVVASKTPAPTADGARAHLETSLRELRRGHIDLYQCHFVADTEAYRTIVSPGGALEGLIAARGEGLISHIGITSHSLDVLEQAIDDGFFDTIMVCFSFLEPKAREIVIPRAVDRNIGVMAMKPFSGGVIEDARLALNYSLSEPGVLVLAGVETPALFDKNWQVFAENEPLSAAQEEEIAALQRQYDKLFCRRCDYCQPCSEDIPIQTVLGIRYLVKRMGKKTFMEGPFGQAVAKGTDCTECGVCMTRCPYELPIPDLIRENLRWLEEQDE